MATTVTINVEDENDDLLRFDTVEISETQVQDLLDCSVAVVKASEEGSSELFDLVEMLKDLLHRNNLMPRIEAK